MTESKTGNELQRAVGRIEGKLDTFISQMAVQDGRATEIEVRLRRVENRQHWYAGAGAVIGAIFTLLGEKFLPGIPKL